MNNIIDAIKSIIEYDNYSIVDSSENNVSQKGKGLESYIQRAFANAFNCSETDFEHRLKETFSYRGGVKNPPDAMIRGGDAIEVKKIESNSQIALNSSFPKRQLFASDVMLTKECKKAESWTQKDIIYAVGIVKENSLKHLFLVYGVDYCASACYSNLSDNIKQVIQQGLKEITFEDSNELGHINKVDPLERTYLRIRGMWGMENPWKVFGIPIDNNKKFTLTAIINDSYWNNMSNHDMLLTIAEQNSNLKIDNFSIKDPDNPQNTYSGRLITYQLDQDRD